MRFLIFIGLLGCIFSVILLIKDAINKSASKTRNYAMIFIASFILFAVGVYNSTDCTPNQ